MEHPLTKIVAASHKGDLAATEHLKTALGRGRYVVRAGHKLVGVYDDATHEKRNVAAGEEVYLSDAAAGANWEAIEKVASRMPDGSYINVGKK